MNIHMQVARGMTQGVPSHADDDICANRNCFKCHGNIFDSLQFQG